METETKENNTKIAGNAAAPEPIRQCPTDYGSAMDFETLDGSQVLREVITDTYVTQDGNEKRMLEQLDGAVEYAYGRRRGFAGYLSWCYAQMTLMFVIEQYTAAKAMLAAMSHGVECARKYLMTGNYLDAEGKPTMFRNYSFGEPDSEMPKTLQYAKDCYLTARLVHRKAGSFESGYAFLVASLLYHTAVADMSGALEDCRHLDELISHLGSYLDSVIANPPESNIGDDRQDYGDVSQFTDEETKSDN